ncbi:MAG: IS110 family transposase [Acidobacteriota bacterium]|nr:IS110 family transposase [Acidobacteriota bacterium]
MKTTTIAIDVAKNVFEIAVSNRPGKVAQTHRLSRTKLLRFFAQQPAATVVLEACTSAHHWARELEALGHQPVLLPPAYVRPYVRRNKTDHADACAILEAFRNEEIRPVPVKTVPQQTLTALHRLRSQWLGDRVARVNTLRGLLREFGVFIPVGARKVVPAVWELIEDSESGLPDALRPALAEACLEIRDLEKRVKACENDLKALSRQMPEAQQLQTIPGIGLLTATALVALVGDVRRFPTARHFASYLGLTPRERSSGQVRRLGRISKQGNSYLRMLLVHGARSLLWSARRREQPDRLQSWALKKQQSRGHNKAAVATANKLARIVWAVWSRHEQYQSQMLAA